MRIKFVELETTTQLSKEIDRNRILYYQKHPEDILGYNRCFSRGHMDNETNRKLRYHIKRCEKLLNEMEK